MHKSQHCRFRMTATDDLDVQPAVSVDAESPLDGIGNPLEVIAEDTATDQGEEQLVVA